MAHGSRELGGASGPPPPLTHRPPRPRRPGAPGAPARLPWAMSHEPSTMNNRLINELFDYILYRLRHPCGIVLWRSSTNARVQDRKRSRKGFPEKLPCKRQRQQLCNELTICHNTVFHNTVFLNTELHSFMNSYTIFRDSVFHQLIKICT